MHIVHLMFFSSRTSHSHLSQHMLLLFFFFFSSRRRHTRLVSDWSSDVCSSDLHRDYKWFSGPTVSGTEGMGGQKFDKDFRGIPGIVYSRNITPAAIRSWTEDRKSVV